MLLKRKQFIQIGSLATASIMLPKFLKAFETPAAVPAGNKVAVILQLSGGNDGLNTVIPIGNDIYYKSRPRLGIEKVKALAITDEVGLHPALTGFKELYDDGSLGIINSVGYPNPDRSHFRSMDIWQTASQSSEYLTSGWLGRYLDAQCSGCDKPTQAIEIDDDQMMGRPDEAAMADNRAKAVAKGKNNSNKGMKPIDADIDWSKFLEYFEKTDRANLENAIAGVLLQTKTAVGADIIKAYADGTSRESFVKSATIQVMSTPEYQLC